MNNRMKKIVQLLLSSNELRTSLELATILQVSSKTIQNDVKKINEIFENNIAFIKSYRGKGYFLQINDDKKFRSSLKSFSEKDVQVIPTEPEERIQFLMEKLLLQSSYLKMDDLADELFVSRSTLQSDINDVRQVVKKYGLTLEHKPNYGIRITGNEMEIRFCISEYVFNHKSGLVDQSTELIEILPKEEFVWIRDSILSNLRKYGIVITDVSLNNLITHIAIACKRIREKEDVEIVQAEFGEITDKKEYIVAQEIVKKMEQKLNVSFSKNEVAYLAIHLQGTKKMHSNSEMDEIENYLEEDIRQLTREILQRIDSVYSLDFSEDNELILSLSLHLEPAINRYKYQMNLRNPLLEEIKNKYLFSYEAALTVAAGVIQEKFGITIDENEIGYIALHFEAALERKKQNEKNKKRCLIVCASGLGTAQLLLLKLKDRFYDELNILGTTEYYNLKNQDFKSLDLIISTIPIPDKLPVPVIQVSTLLGKQDVNKIERLVRGDIAVIERYMLKNFTYLKMDFSTKEEIIQFLGKELLNAGLVNEHFVDSVLERERYSTTSFGNLVAVPHPMDPQVDETFWSVVTLKSPIQWGDKLVQFVCLLNISEQNQMEDSKPMYDVLMKLLDNRLLVQKILQCNTYAELKNTLKKV